MPTTFVVGPLVLLREKYPCNTPEVWRFTLTNCTESQACNDCTYRQNSVSTNCLIVFDNVVGLALKELNTLLNRMSTIKIVLFIVYLHARKFA